MNFLIPTCILLFCFSSAVSAQNYKAGVVLYKIVPPTGGPTPFEHMSMNADLYLKLMESVKDKVDILVFPEYGLTTLEIIPQQERSLPTYSTIVHKVGTHVCDPKSNKILPRLACAAQQNNLYVVVNLLEKDGESYYVTSVGLDRNGTICSRCRKQRLFKGLHFSTPSAVDDESCVFIANFKAATVTFSVMFDTDMLYKIPAKLKNENVIMTSSITNGLPLEFGLSLEAGFAVGNGVNLLVSSLWDAARNFGGSGIYHKNGTSVVAMDAEKVPGALNGSTILIRDVQSKSDSQKVNFVAEDFGEIPPLNVSYKKIDGLANTNKTVTKKCSDDDENLCCSFSAEVDQESISPYRWVVISNKTTILDQTVDVFICALVKPSAGANPVKFKNVSISSNLRRSQVDQSLPISLTKDFVPASFGYVEGEAGTSITLNEEKELLTFGIVQVMPPHKGGGGGSSNTALIVVIVLLVLVVLAVGGFLIWRKRQRKNRSAL